MIVSYSLLIYILFFLSTVMTRIVSKNNFFIAQPFVQGPLDGTKPFWSAMLLRYFEDSLGVLGRAESLKST